MTYGVGWSLPAWGLAAAFVTPWYWLLIAAGGLLLITAGCVDYVTREGK